jgi:hypothetical protein
MTGKQELNRRKWVEEYNNSLPQITYYDEEFGEYFTYAKGGIYDSEYMCYVYENFSSRRIKRIKYQIRQENKIKKIHNIIFNDN